MFNKEQELVSAFSSMSNDFLKALLHKSVPRSFLLHEFDSYFGVADVVLGTFKSSMGKQLRESVNPNWISLLASLKRGEKFSLEEFCQSHSLSRSSALKRVNEYEEAGFIVKTKDDRFRVVKEYKVVADLVISVEAKLRDWRKALSQAHRYKRFSDLTFVLLDGAQATSAISNIKLFEDGNIGLISLTEEKIDFHFVPKKNKKKMSESYLRINEVAYDHFTSAQKSY